MSGNRYVLDTNAIVALLQGNSQLIQLLQGADWIRVSVISQIEFLTFSGLSQEDCQLFGPTMRLHLLVLKQFTRVFLVPSGYYLKTVHTCLIWKRQKDSCKSWVNF